MTAGVAGPTIFLSVGEHSGERIAVDLMDAIRRRAPGARFLGVGGPLMQAHGFELRYDLSQHSVMWMWDALRVAPDVGRTILRLGREMAAERPDVVVAIDSPGFNFHMARKARRLGIPSCYYVAPQVWAYNQWRVVKLRRMVDRLLVILPFEVEFFRRHGIDARYVGHPLIERLGRHALDAELVARLEARPTLAVLPGSRRDEVGRSLPVMLEVAARLRDAGLVAQVAVSSAKAELEAQLRGLIEASGVEAEIVAGSTPELLSGARLALVTSGTVTLETAYFRRPALVLYRRSAFDLFLGRPWMQVRHIALPNLIADAPFMDEWLTAGEPVEEMTARAKAILGDPALHARLVAQQDAVRARMLAEPSASARAAEEVLAMAGAVLSAPAPSASPTRPAPGVVR
jgi:lipid-A-disaccharide synthase